MIGISLLRSSLPPLAAEPSTITPCNATDAFQNGSLGNIRRVHCWSYGLRGAQYNDAPFQSAIEARNDPLAIAIAGLHTQFPALISAHQYGHESIEEIYQFGDVILDYRYINSTAETNPVGRWGMELVGSTASLAITEPIAISRVESERKLLTAAKSRAALARTLGQVSLLIGHTIEWDHETHTIRDDPSANQLLHHLPGGNICSTLVSNELIS